MAAAALALGKPVRLAGERRREVEGELQSHVQQTLAGINVVQAFGQEWRQHRHLRAARRRGRGVPGEDRARGGLNTLASGMVGTLGCRGRAVRRRAPGAGRGPHYRFADRVHLLPDRPADRSSAGWPASTPASRRRAPSIDRVVEVLDASPDVVDRPGAVALVGGAGRGGVRGCVVRLRAGPAGAARGQFRGGAGGGGGARRPDGGGQEHAGGLVAAVLRSRWRGGCCSTARTCASCGWRACGRRCRLVLQEPFLFPLSIAENIAYGRPGATREEIEAAARGGERARVRRAAAGGLRHGGRRARRDAVGRRAAAGGDRAGVAEGRAGAGARRADQRAGRRDRGARCWRRWSG